MIYKNKLHQEIKPNLNRYFLDESPTKKFSREDEGPFFKNFCAVIYHKNLVTISLNDEKKVLVRGFNAYFKVGPSKEGIMVCGILPKENDLSGFVQELPATPLTKVGEQELCREYLLEQPLVRDTGVENICFNEPTREFIKSMQ